MMPDFALLLRSGGESRISSAFSLLMVDFIVSTHFSFKSTFCVSLCSSSHSLCVAKLCGVKFLKLFYPSLQTDLNRENRP